MEASAPLPGSFPRTTSQLRAVLEQAGLRPSKGKGQCFLTDVQAIDAIVRDAEVSPGDVIVEVGTGPGLLTHALCEAGARVITFEIDARIQALARSLRTWPASVEFVQVDVLESKRTLHPRFAQAFVPSAGEPVKLVSNLPYSVATPVLLSVLGLPVPPRRIVAMVQLEVGEKLLAPVNSPQYGAPSVQLQVKGQGSIVRRFGPKVFWPAPRVRSALLDLRPLEPAALATQEHLPFGVFVTALFTRRRKVLSSAVSVAAPQNSAAQIAAALRLTALSPTSRAQEISPLALLALWRALRDSGLGERVPTIGSDS